MVATQRADKRIRFSLNGSTGLTWAQHVHVAQTIEALGFHGFYPSDHLYLPGRGPTDDTLDSLTAIAALAAHTRTLRLGVLVAGNLFRHPVLTAKIMTTVDHASDGRAELGIGANWDEAECVTYGIPYPPLRERAARLRDAVRTITSLWTSDRTTVDSTFYPLRDAPFLPKPVQRPHPPLIIGGASTAVMRIAAAYADEWNCTGAYHLAQAGGARFSAICAELGRDPASIRRSVVLTLVLTHDRAEAERATARVASGLRNNPRVAPEMRTLPDAELAKDSALIGPPEVVTAQIQRWVDLGMRHVFFFTPRPFDPAHLERFAHDVMPHFA